MKSLNVQQDPVELFPTFQHIPIGRKIAEILSFNFDDEMKFQLEGEKHPSSGLYSIGVTFNDEWIADSFGEDKPFVTGLSQSEYGYIVREYVKYIVHIETSMPDEVITFFRNVALPVAGITGVYPFDEIQFHCKMKEYMPLSHSYIAMNKDPSLNKVCLTEELPNGHFNLGFIQDGDWVLDAFGEDKDVCINLTKEEANTIANKINNLEKESIVNIRKNLIKATQNHTTV